MKSKGRGAAGGRLRKRPKSHPTASTPFHCSLSERSWTDLVTNSTLLNQVEFSKDLGSYLQPGGFPQKSLPGFIHEAIHHWCFHSVVGTTLASLELRSRLAIVGSAMSQQDEGEQQAVEDIMRFDLAQKLLRPLAEGMALLAEHDVEPKAWTKRISRPMAWVSAAFTTPEEDESQRKLFRPLIVALRRMRVSEEHIRRKANLFLEPLSASSAGGYLAGYLTVKGLWRLAQRRTGRFADADLFCTFLQRYFYRDYGFVACLLQQRTSGVRAAEEMVEYFDGRLESLKRMDLEPEAERLDRSDEALNTDPEESISPVINTPAELVKEGKRLLAESTRRLLVSPEDSPEAKRLKRFHERTLARRSFMCLGRGTVSVEPSKPGFMVVKSDGQDVLEIATLPEWKPTRTDGILDLQISMPGLFSVVAISANGKLIALSRSENSEKAFDEYAATVSLGGVTTTAVFTKDMASLFLEQMQEYLMDQTHADKLNEVMRTARETFIDQIGFRAKYNKIQLGLGRVVDEIYKSAAMGWADSERVGSCYALMEKQGLYPILNKDRKLVVALAGLSLAASVGMYLEEARQHLPPGVTTVDQDLRALEKCSREKGFPLVFPLEDKLDSFV